MFKLRNCFLLLLVIATSNCLFGQEKNPFDLVYRLPKIKKDSLSFTGNKEINPFDIPNKREIKKGVFASVAQTKNSIRKLKFNKTAIPSGDFFGFYIGMLSFIALISALSRNVFFKIRSCFFNFKKLRVFQREAVNFYLIPLILLYLFWLFNLTFFVNFLNHYYVVFQLSGSIFSQIIRLFLLILLIFVLKHILLYGVSKIFPVSKELEHYHFMIINNHIVAGLLLFPLNFILSYISIKFVTIFLTTGLVLLISIFVYRFVGGLLIGSKYIFGSFFHFLLYLCTVEIAPFIILLKFLLVNTGF